VKRLLTICLISSCATYAQEDISSNTISEEGQDTVAFTYNAFKEKVYFWQMEKNWKLSPFDIFSAVPTFGIDLETTMKPGISFQYGAAIIPSFLQFTTGSSFFDSYNWMNGYRLRFESRWSGFKKPNIYVSTELAFRHLLINNETSFGMEGDGFGNFAYFINQDMLYHRFSTHLNVKYGLQKVFDNNLVLDMFAGISVRQNNVIEGSKRPDGGAQAQEWWDVFNWRLEDGHRFGYVTPIMGLRIGWHKEAKANL
jgi:hypothetical protein